MTAPMTCRFVLSRAALGGALGALAVLISQSHTYRDIYMPINAAEMRLLDAIDGNRSIGHVVDKALASSREASPPDMVRAFFERRWWHDQVVFDISAG